MKATETFEWASMLVGVASIAVGTIRLLSYAAALAPMPFLPQVKSPVSPWATASIVLLGYGLVGLSQWRDSPRVRLAVIVTSLLAAIAPFGGALTHQSPGIAASLHELLTTRPLGLIAIFLSSASLVVRAINSERFIAGLLGAMVALIGFFVALGYLRGGPLLPELGWKPVPLTSALATVFIGVGLVTVGGPTAWPNRLFVRNSAQ